MTWFAFPEKKPEDGEIILVCDRSIEKLKELVPSNQCIQNMKTPIYLAYFVSELKGFDFFPARGEEMSLGFELWCRIPNSKGTTWKRDDLSDDNIIVEEIVIDLVNTHVYL